MFMKSSGQTNLSGGSQNVLSAAAIAALPVEWVAEPAKLAIHSR